MKRKPSSEQFTHVLSAKQTAKKSRSPNNIKKHKPKFQNQILSFLAPHKSKVTKKKEESQKGQLKGDSHNSTTNCTFSRPRLQKAKNNKEKEDKQKKIEHLNEGQIMEIINNFATKIQRQWRVCLFRKRFKQFVSTQLKIHRKSQQKRHSPEISVFEKLKFDQNKIKHLSYLTDNGQQIVSTYNLEKYQKYESSSLTNQRQTQNNDPLSYRSQANSDKNSIKLLKDPEQKMQKQNSSNSRHSHSQDSLSSNPRAKSKQSKRAQGKQTASKNGSKTQLERIEEKEERRVSYDSCQLQKKSNMQNRRKSTGDLLSHNRQLKTFQIDKAFQIKIVQLNPPMSSEVNKINENSPAKRGENEREAFNIKYPFDKALKHKRKQIQDYKQKKLLSIQSRFKRKEVTQRSYFQICKKINQQHDNRLQYFRQRQGEIRSNWCKLLAISKDSRLTTKYLQDDHDRLHNSISNIDASISFDRWDFNSSAKKSIDENLLEFGEGQNSKNYSLQSVLKYLEDKDGERQIDQKKFKKNKTSKVIEAIAQRSKEMSDRSIDEFYQVKQEKKVKGQKEKYEILQQPIQVQQITSEKPTQDQQHEQKETNVVEQKKIEPKNHSFELDLDCQKQVEVSSKKKIEPKSQSQSLLISQIEANSPSDNIFSDKDITQSVEKPPLKELLFKNFQSQEDKAPPESFLLNKFVQLVNEKVVLSNIKIINSIKFMFAKMGQEKKQQKARTLIKFPPIQTDINAVNTWLLQISHFILDNYQTVIRDNLTIIKQPPSLELLGHAHKNLPYMNPYQTVPEYVFKDFQFYYIKTLARNYGVGADKYDAFSTLLYTFHRSLIDSLNLALTEELITGRKWLQVPWANKFQYKKKIQSEHAKSCLERSINVVSNWGEYSLGRLSYDDEIAELQNKQYEEEKINLVCREQALDIQLSFTFKEANMLLSITNFIFQMEITNAFNDIFC